VRRVCVCLTDHRKEKHTKKKIRNKDFFRKSTKQKRLEKKHNMMEDFSRHSEVIAIMSISYVCSYTMGSIISLFRPKELDTNSQLEEIETKLKLHFEKRTNTIRLKSALYTKTRNYGLGCWSILLAGLYLTFPDENIRRFIQIVFVFIIYPVAVLLIRKFWKYYYERRLTKVDDEIKSLDKQKESILKDVMEKEPYNKAREILKRFGSNQAFEVPKAPTQQRKKLVNGKPIDDQAKRAMNSTVSEPTKKLPQPNVQRQLSQTIGGMSPILRTPGTQGNSTMTTPQVRKTVRKTVRPLPSEKLNQSNIEKMVDWVVGSKPEQMYALICKNCKMHNGLAIKEEFEYMEWRCAFCHFLNMASKQRPAPPQLQPQRPMDVPRSISPSTSTSSRADSVERKATLAAPIRKVSLQSKGEDSGTESDQMEKKEIQPETVSENEEENDQNSQDELDESILASGPVQQMGNKSDDETLENE